MVKIIERLLFIHKTVVNFMNLAFKIIFQYKSLFITDDFIIKSDELIIGRGENCHIKIPDETISKKQIKFEFNVNENNWHIILLSEKLKTFLNNDHININKKYLIKPDSKIIFGNITIIISNKSDNCLLNDNSENFTKEIVTVHRDQNT